MTAVLLTAASTSCLAAEQAPLPPNKVLVSNQWVTITYEEFEAEMARFPAADRSEILLDKQRIARLVENLLINKTLAKEARQHKLDESPKAQAEIRVSTDKILAKYRGQQFQNELPKANYEKLARENYLAYPEKTTTPEKHEVWHLLVNTKGRTQEQAMARAEGIRKRLLAGETPESLAETLSEDPSAAENKGNLGLHELSKFDPRFATEVRKLKVGEVSAPFETHFGIHIAKLIRHLPAKRHSFEDVKQDLINEAENQYLRSVWAEYIRKIQNDPKLFVDTAALDALRPKFDVPPIPGAAPATPGQEPKAVNRK